jgi:hypothetical protein
VEACLKTAVRNPAAGSHPAFRPLELVAVVWVVEEVGEIRKQVQAVVKQKAGRASPSCIVGSSRASDTLKPSAPSLVGSVV